LRDLLYVRTFRERIEFFEGSWVGFVLSDGCRGEEEMVRGRRWSGSCRRSKYIAELHGL
jgi:hypothetical protein